MIKRILSIMMVLCLTMALMPAVALAGDDFTYIDENGVERPAGGIEITKYTTTLNGGYYVVNDSIEIKGDSFTVNGNVHIILVEKCTMYMSTSMTLADNSSLTIYGQKESAGCITICSDNTAINGGENTSIKVNSGKLEAISYGNDFAIKATNVEINGGNLQGTGYAGIQADSIKINGGMLVAYGKGGNGIKSGNNMQLNGGTLELYDGCTCDAVTKYGLGYTDDNMIEYVGLISKRELSACSGVLTPFVAASSWSGLQAAFNNTGPRAIPAIWLYVDLKAASGENCLVVPKDKSATLNLNGHVLDRGLSNVQAVNNGNVIEVKGSLKLMDGDPSEEHAGTYAKFPNGGVIIGGNSTNGCGGIYIDTGGTLTMNGGTILGNSTSVDGGGVYVDTDGTFTMSGGAISENSVSGNGGGVYVNSGKFNVSGSPQVKGNTKCGTANNVYLYDSGINVGVLKDGAAIGVSMQSPGVFTEGATFENNEAARAVFSADNNSAYEVKSSDGQAMLSPLPATAPDITTQPSSSTTLPYGYSTGGTLTVGASAATDMAYEALAYQWYSNTAAGNRGGTPIDGATGRDFDIPTGLDMGDHYYYCVVTATRTDNGQSAHATSGVATVTVKKSAVTIAAEDKEATWSTDGIVIPPEGMFTFPTSAGKPAYSVSNGTGKGSHTDGKLTVERCGTFTVTVNTVETETCTAGSASATLTVNKVKAAVAVVSANNRTYDGTEKPLVTVDESTIKGGEIQYALGTDPTLDPTIGWSTIIPQKSEAGTYYVWYKAVGDGNHYDSDPSCVTVVIKPAGSDDPGRKDGDPVKPDDPDNSNGSDASGDKDAWRVPLLDGQIYASSKDNFGVGVAANHIGKLTMDFANVVKSAVKPSDLRMTVIAGSRFSTVAALKGRDSSSSTGGVKVKVNKKTLKATVSCKKSGTATLTMDDGTTYTISFTVDKPKAVKSGKKMQTGGAMAAKTIKELFGTDIDSGSLLIKKQKHEQATLSGNELVISPAEKDSIKILYQFLNKKYKMNIKVK